MSEIIRKELEDLEEELNSLMTSSQKEEVQMAAGAGAEREPEAANPNPFHGVGGGVEVVRAGAVDRACAASPDPPYDSGRERPPDQDMAEHRSPGKFRSLFQDKTEAQRQDTYNSGEDFLARERKRRRLAGGGTTEKM